MKLIALVMIFFASTMTAFAEPLIVKTAAEEMHRSNSCQTSANFYTKEACKEIRRAEKVRDEIEDSQSPMTIQDQDTTKSATTQNAVPEWQKALQPPATSNTSQ